MVDKDSLAQAFARTRQRLHAYLRRRLADPGSADDLLQEVFVKALTAQQRGTPIRNLDAWLYTTTRSVLADHYRRKAVVTEPLHEALTQPADDDEQAQQQLAECMLPLIEQLPALYRETLLQVDIRHRRMRELAAQDGVSVSAIKSRAARGRRLLKETLLACCEVQLESGRIADFQPLSMADCCDTRGETTP